MVSLGFTFTSCVKEDNTNDSTEETTEVNTPSAVDKLGGDVPLDEEGKRVIENLTNNGYWYVEHWHKVVAGNKRDAEAYDQNKARWYKFNKDGSFTHGKKKETVGKGTWSYNSQIGAVKMLAEDKRYNAEFAVDLHSQGGMMSWTSTKRFNSENIMALLEEYVELMAELP